MNPNILRPEIVALVPMRHQSERVPGKNYRELASRPLYAYIISALLDVPEISQVVVDTDSPVITEGLTRIFPRVQVLARPEDLRGGDVPMNNILLYDTSVVEGDYYLQTHSTNPFLRAATISKAIKAFLDSYPAHDSLFSVTPLQKRLWDGDIKPLNHDPTVLLRTQDLPPVYEENSCIYMFTRENLAARKNRLGERPMMFVMDASEALDIDDEMDFRLAEALMASERPTST